MKRFSCDILEGPLGRGYVLSFVIIAVLANETAGRIHHRYILHRRRRGNGSLPPSPSLRLSGHFGPPSLAHHERHPTKHRRRIPRTVHLDPPPRSRKQGLLPLRHPPRCHYHPALLRTDLVSVLPPSSLLIDHAHTHLLPAPTPSSDLQRHLLAGSVYISSTSDCAVREGLAQAAFWVFVIQDIQSALIRRSPLRLTFRLFHDQLLDLWRRLSPSPSSLARILSQKSIWILAETINLCYGDEQINGTSSTTTTTTTTNPAELKDRIRSLELDLPPAFRALHFSPADLAAGRPFPVVWFTSCSHGMSVPRFVSFVSSKRKKTGRGKLILD